MSARWVLPFLVVGGLYAADSAVLKQPTAGAAFIQVEIGVTGVRSLAPVLMKTTDDGSEAIATPAPVLESGPGVTRFTLPVAGPDPKASYFVVIAPTAVGDVPRVLEVTRELSVALKLARSCTGLQVRLQSENTLDVAGWGQIFDWLHRPDPSGIATVTTHPAGKSDRQIGIRRVDSGNQSASQMAADQGASVCLVLSAGLPPGSFRTEVAFHGAPRGELTTPLVNDAMTVQGLGTPSAAGSSDGPGVRTVERNLDASVTLTSEVNPPNPDASAVCANNGKRCTTGVFDIRLAPWLNILGRNLDVKRWIGLYTPIYVDASVSTAKIAKDTLSQNRVVFGSEYEFRRYSDSKPGGTFQRVILRGSHASDRDFKQKEYSASVEYKPVLSMLSQPIQWTWTTDRRVNDADGLPVRVYRNFGWDIQPLVGAEIGHTYSRRNPAPAVQPGPAVRRFYWGGTVTLDITRRLTLSGSDTFYVRGESAADRVHNYLKAEADVPLWMAGGKVSSLFFVSYERGGRPPFQKPDVNSFVVGYRVQSQGWFGQQR